MHVSFALPNQQGKQPLWLHMLMLVICSILEGTSLSFIILLIPSDTICYLPLQ
jgi:hypothetical protein